MSPRGKLQIVGALGVITAKIRLVSVTSSPTWALTAALVTAATSQ
jgi:hypothetical protein